MYISKGEIDPIKKEKDELTRYVVHASCSDIDKAVADIAQTYDWQCNDCKSCLVCLSKNDEVCQFFFLFLFF